MSKDTSDKKTHLRISENIKRYMDVNWENVKRFNETRDFIFKSTLSAVNKSSLMSLNKPLLEFNVSEAFLSRLRGEFSKNEPAILVSIQDGTVNNPKLEMQRELVEGYIRYIFNEAKRNGTQTAIFDEVVSGGFSSSKIYTEYQEGETFRQKIVWEKCYDSTLTGFDVLSRHPSKKDSEYCFELYPLPKDRFEKDFDEKIENISFSNTKENFNWFYKVGDLDVVVVADYYEIEYVNVAICELSNGEVIRKKEYNKIIEQLSEETIAVPPVIVDEREYKDKKIMRYHLCGNKILKTEEMKEYSMLPHVFFDGNSVVLNENASKTELMTRPYLFNTKGTQKLIDQLGIALADECQNLSKHKLLIASESIDPAYIDHITRPSMNEVLVYKAFYQNDPAKPNPPPQQMVRNAFPQEMLGLLQYMITLFQTILGSHDAQLGINNNQLSGAAIIQGSIHAGATAEPFVNKYILSLNRVAEVILNLIPKVYKNEMTIPVIDKEGKTDYVPVNGQNNIDLDYDATTLKIKVDAGVGFAAQKTQAMMQIIQLAQSMPIFGQFMNTKGLAVLVENLDIKGADLLKLMAEEFMQELEQQKQQEMQMQQQQAQMNPMVMREQNNKLELENKIKQSDVENSINIAKLSLEQEKLELKKAELVGKIQTEEKYIDMKQEEIDADKARTIIESATKSVDQHHRHLHESVDMSHRHDMDVMNLGHKISSSRKTTGTPHLKE